MIVIPSLRPETRYGMPAADLLLFNREYILGYSNLFRQPRWAMEVIDPTNKRVDFSGRLNNFRTDLRIPEQFRAELEDYVGAFDGKKYDRGHLISSADRRSSNIRNSETFLMSNMSPQVPEFNRGIWKNLEQAVRELASMYVEVYTICGPLFNIGEKIKVIGKGDTQVVVPHSFFKSILAEKERGKIDLWTFVFRNEAPAKGKPKQALKDFLRPTNQVETWSGLHLWDRLRGPEIGQQKRTASTMWSVTEARKAARLLKTGKK